MPATFTLPECIVATRVGQYPESEFDAFGEAAPVTWFCACGSRLVLEHFEVHYASDYDEERDYPSFEGYVATSQERKDEFLAAHNACPLVCFKCRTAPVEFSQQWCEPCSENEQSSW